MGRGLTMRSKKVEKLLDKAWGSSDSEEAISLANQILDIEQDNIEALIILADNTDKAADRLLILKEAFESLLEPENFHSDDKNELFAALFQRIAYEFLAGREYKKALDATETCLELIAMSDNPEEFDECLDEIKTLHYRALLGVGDLRKLQKFCVTDPDHGVAWAYSRLFLAWKISGGAYDKQFLEKSFWEALSISPDVPFYLLLYYDEPEDENDEAFRFALMFIDAMPKDKEFTIWFSKGTLLFGLLTNRFDAGKKEYALEMLEAFRGYELYEEMSNLISSTDDKTVIETLAAHKCLSK